MPQIAYRQGYKYQLAEPYEHQTPFRGFDFGMQFLEIRSSGLLRFSQGYTWDGPSGLTVDTQSSMRASLVHDGCYQLMRLRVLDPDKHRAIADRLLRDICIEDGMWRARAWAWYAFVRAGAGFAAMPEAEPVILRAP